VGLVECKREVREAGLVLVDASTFIANFSKSTADHDAAQGADKPTQVLNSSKNGIENYIAGFILQVRHKLERELIIASIFPLNFDRIVQPNLHRAVIAR
jgi:hypothetical protein